jgi:hypothetical protein
VLFTVALYFGGPALDGRMQRKVLWRGAENDVGVRQQPRDEVPVQRLGARIRMVRSAEWSGARV